MKLMNSLIGRSPYMAYPVVIFGWSLDALAPCGSVSVNIRAPWMPFDPLEVALGPTL